MKIMKLLALFWEGGKEGWNENVATDDLVAVNNKTSQENDTNYFSFSEEEPAFDDVYAANHQTYHPNHRLYK